MPNQPPVKGPKHGKGMGRRQQLLVFGGAAAAVAVFALAKRNSSGAGTSTDTAAGTTGVQGTYDSTANDVYNSLEDQLGALQQQIQQIAAGQGTSISGTGSGPTKGSGSGTPKGTVAPGPGSKPGTPKPVKGKTPPKTTLQTVTVKRNQTLSGIAAAHHETLGQLYKDNPIYKTNPKYKGGNRIFAGDKVKVR